MNKFYNLELINIAKFKELMRRRFIICLKNGGDAGRGRGGVIMGVGWGGVRGGYNVGWGWGRGIMWGEWGGGLMWVRGGGIMWGGLEGGFNIAKFKELMRRRGGMFKKNWGRGGLLSGWVGGGRGWGYDGVRERGWGTVIMWGREGGLGGGIMWGGNNGGGGMFKKNGGGKRLSSDNHLTDRQTDRPT
ncbi:hypothetical protein DPMN_194066 [Dreissena polymorpha]|uniref:Uncharacterized protein n=1 Tax=Dreissena polymorpha TaxID=45954 RepID=A0A9D4BDF0_DREPO|nr:hypothetical protein DPMN_194066 [Dreissena polymorpha]